MPTISFTQKLVPLIEDLSQNITAIATLLKDAQAAESTSKKQETTPQSKSQKQSPKKSSQSTEASGTDSSATSVSVTVEDVRAVLAEKSQDGLTAKVRELLESFDAKKLSAVDPDRLPELLEAAKALK